MTGAVMTGSRLSLRAYASLVWRHYRAHWRGYTLPLLAVCVAQLFVRIDVNLTDSLPDHVFLTVKGMRSGVARGDYIAFSYQGTGPASPFPKGFHFVKMVAGVPGDRIEMDPDRRFYRKGEYQEVVGDSALPVSEYRVFLGRAKETSKAGYSLAPGPVGIIPPGQYYVMAPHPDSLDSRYVLTGWVKESEIIGKSFALF